MRPSLHELLSRSFSLGHRRQQGKDCGTEGGRGRGGIRSRGAYSRLTVRITSFRSLSSYMSSLPFVSPHVAVVVCRFYRETRYHQDPASSQNLPFPPPFPPWYTAPFVASPQYTPPEPGIYRSISRELTRIGPLSISEAR